MKLMDIANAAGVSTAPVSNVINGNHSKVSAANIKRIQKLIKQFNYVPKASARNLASKHTKMLGVVIPGELYADGNPHNALLLSSFEQCIRVHGYYLLLRCADTIEDAVTTLTMWDVDGAIILGYLDPDMDTVLKAGRRNFPVVLVDSYLEAEYPNSMVIRLNDYKGGHTAGRYLVDKGHKALAFVGASYNNSGVVTQRYNGFRDALAEDGLQAEKLDFKISYRDGLKAGTEICRLNAERSPNERLTAVFASSDIAAVGIIEGLRQRELRVPEDLSVIGFDNAHFCNYTGLTTMKQDVQRKAELAAELLIGSIAGKTQVGISILEPELVERGSVGCPAAIM